MSKEKLLKEIEKNIPDSNRQSYYNQLGKIYIAQSWRKIEDIDSAFHFLRKGIYLKDSANRANNDITNESLCLLGVAYLRSGDMTTGRKVFDQAIRSYQKTGNKIKEADTWMWEGRYLSYLEINPDTLLNCFRRAVLLYSEARDPLKEIDAKLEIANFYFRYNYFSRADSELQTILQVSKANGLYRILDIYFFLSSVNRYAGNYNRALRYALEAVKNLEQSKDTSHAEKYYGELALVYQDLDQPEKSIYWYGKCLNIRVKNPAERFSYRTAYFMVVQMIKIKQAKQAIEMLNNLKKINPPVHADEKATLSQSLAYCNRALGKYSLAEKYFLDMIREYDNGQNDPEELMIAHYDVGKFYVEINQYGKARPYIEKAITLSASTTASRIMDLHFLLFKTDSAAGNFQSAIQHYEKYKAINDSIFNVTKSRQIEELLIKYETEKKDNNIKLLENETKLQQGKLTQANQTRNWIIGVAALLLIITVLLVNNARLKQRANKKLQVQQSEIEKKNNSLQHLVREKEWLVKEIHHRVKNNFHIVMGLLGTQTEYLKTEEAIQAIAESQHRIQAMSLIHQKLYQSDNLSAINLAEYIHELVNSLRESFTIRQSIQFKFDIDQVELDLSHCIPLGLIMNEAITNSIKYAFPHNKEKIISISFKHLSEHHLMLIISDNGIGLPAEFNTRKLNSMGMKLMQGLSDDIEGEFSISNHNGTEIRLAFIYDPEITSGTAKMKPEPTNSI